MKPVLPPPTFNRLYGVALRLGMASVIWLAASLSLLPFRGAAEPVIALLLEILFGQRRAHRGIYDYAPEHYGWAVAVLVVIGLIGLAFAISDAIGARRHDQGVMNFLARRMEEEASRKSLRMERRDR